MNFVIAELIRCGENRDMTASVLESSASARPMLRTVFGLFDLGLGDVSGSCQLLSICQLGMANMLLVSQLRSHRPVSLLLRFLLLLLQQSFEVIVDLPIHDYDHSSVVICANVSDHWIDEFECNSQNLSLERCLLGSRLAVFEEHQAQQMTGLMICESSRWSRDFLDREKCMVHRSTTD